MFRFHVAMKRLQGRGDEVSNNAKPRVDALSTASSFSLFVIAQGLIVALLLRSMWHRIFVITTSGSRSGVRKLENFVFRGWCDWNCTGDCTF